MSCLPNRQTYFQQAKLSLGRIFSEAEGASSDLNVIDESRAIYLPVVDGVRIDVLNISKEVHFVLDMSAIHILCR